MKARFLKELTSENWVERRNAANKIGRKKIKEAEIVLIDLLNDMQPQVIEVAAKSLARLESNQAIPKLIEMFDKVKDNDFVRGAPEALIEALGQSNGEKAMFFLGKILTETKNKTYQRAAAARSLAFYHDRRAVEFLISVLKPDISSITKEALISLGKIGRTGDIERIINVTRKISLEAPTGAAQKAIKDEGFDDSSSTYVFYFISGCIERIMGRMANKVLVLGWLEGVIDMRRYEKAYKSLRTELTRGDYKAYEEQRVKKYWENPDIANKYLSNKMASKLVKEAVIELHNGKEHPDVQAILDIFETNGVLFRRSRTGIKTEEADLRLVQWAKDGSLLIPTLKGFIPFSLSSGDFPVCGETAMIPGRNPLLLVSESVLTSARSLKEMFPDIDIEIIPAGFITVKLPSGELILRGTSHTDCVINVVFPEATKENIPIVLIDPRYYKEMTSRERTARLLKDIEEKYESKIVVIPEEETYLNPANFILTDKNIIILNYAPKTYKKLLQAGIKPESLIMMDREITSLAPLGGMIGCLAGIYREDRILPAKGGNNFEKRRLP